MLACITSACLQGVEALPVQVETKVGRTGDGATYIIVGLPDSAVRESVNRVHSAIGSSGYRVPFTTTTVNLAPGDLRKEGPIYDLPIALALLIAMEQIAAPAIQECLIAGELGLTGRTRPVRGALAFTLLAKRLGLRRVLLPAECAQEAALVEGVDVLPIRTLHEACGVLAGTTRVEPVPYHNPLEDLAPPNVPDFADVRGQHALRRAVEVAVAGGHNLLMIGPPGSGKSMIAKRIPGIMPEPTLAEYLEILAIHSAAGRTLRGVRAALARPFRAPHHTISDAGLLGGGAVPGPGEISLAHNGVLFLDELPEFHRSALEVMRQPLEDGSVTISRSAAKVTLPAGFMLVAAMNPCPCGYLGDPRRACTCLPAQVQRYRARVSGPLLDRIDIHVEAPPVAIADLRGDTQGETTAMVRSRIVEARRRQTRRFAGTDVTCNARMPHHLLCRHVPLNHALGELLQSAMERMQLSARAFERIIKVARTIADLAGTDAVEAPHLLEAIQYRNLDRTRADA